jgi:hypothetical protein
MTVLWELKGFSYLMLLEGEISSRDDNSKGDVSINSRCLGWVEQLDLRSFTSPVEVAYYSGFRCIHSFQLCVQSGNLVGHLFGCGITKSEDETLAARIA